MIEFRGGTVQIKGDILEYYDENGTKRAAINLRYYLDVMIDGGGLDKDRHSPTE